MADVGERATGESHRKLKEKGHCRWRLKPLSKDKVCDGLIATSHITALSPFTLVNTCAHYKALGCWQVQLHFTDGGIEAEKGETTCLMSTDGW